MLNDRSGRADKIDFLDGLRGVAAFTVVCFHFLLIFYPAVLTGNPAQAHLPGALDAALYKVPNFLYNGNFAVCVFFVLSGYVLSYKFWQEKDARRVTASACRRYFRLTLPILASILLAYLLVKYIGAFNREVFLQAHSLPIFGEIYLWQPDFFLALKDGVWNTYFCFTVPGSYNPVLWTMGIELQGSFLVFTFLALFGKVKNRAVLYAGLCLLCYDSYSLAFVLGMGCSDLIYSREADHCRSWLFRLKSLPGLCLLVGIYFGSFKEDGVYHILGALFLLYGVLGLPWLQSFFCCRFCLFLGRVSFSLYLVHIPVFASISSALFLLFRYRGIPYLEGTVFVFLLSLPLVFLLAYLMFRYVDQPSISWSRKIQKKYFAE